MEFNVKPGDGSSRSLMEGEQADLSFSIRDASGTPLRSIQPVAWIDGRSTATTDEKQCHDKVQGFLQASLSAQPAVDLNTYYILVLNDEPSISVIDPLLGFGTSKLYTLILLKSPGEDWVLSRDKTRLLVSMPGANQVAVVDTATWKVIANVDAGAKPGRLALQMDEKYLWAATDIGVAVLDTATLKRVALIPTGAGRHEIAFSGDDRYAFVSNDTAGTVSVVDAQQFSKVQDLRTGPSPVAVAYSPKSKAVYVADQEDGTVTVIDAEKLEIVGRLKDKPGLRAIRFAPGGRWGFVINGRENRVAIFDSSSNQFVQNAEVGQAPDKISFSDTTAYVRSTATAQVSMIMLSELGKNTTVPVLNFPGGQLAPAASDAAVAADVIVPSSEPGVVLVANPADSMIYYYSEGMAAPMGNFQNYKRAARAVTVVDRNLRETAPGVYSTRFTIPGSGHFDVAFYLDSPKVVHCFDLAVVSNPALKAQKLKTDLEIVPLKPPTSVPARASLTLKVRVVNKTANEPQAGLNDLGAMVVLAPGTWSRHLHATHVGEGTYEVSFVPPRAGLYYVYWQCPSCGLDYAQSPALTLRAIEQSSPSSATSLPVRESFGPPQR